MWEGSSRGKGYTHTHTHTYMYVYIYIHMYMAAVAAAAAAKSLQSCPTLCEPIDGSPPVSSIPGILQARTLKWVVVSFSNHESEKWKWSCSVMSDSATPWTAAYHAPPSMGFSRPEYWSGVPLPSLAYGYIYIYSLFIFLYGRNKPAQHCKAIIFQLKKRAYSVSLTAEGTFTYYLTQSTC